MMDKPYKIDIEDVNANKPLLNASNLPPNYALNNKHLSKKIPLSTLDKILSSTIFCFLVSCCWRGTSGIFDLHYQYFPYLGSLLLAFFIFLVLALTQRNFQGIDQSKWLNFALAKTYFLLGYIATILHFRTLWAYYDVVDEQFYALGTRWNVSRCVCTVSLVAIASASLACVKGVVNLNSPPMVIEADVREKDFVVEFAFFKDYTMRVNTPIDPARRYALLALLDHVFASLVATPCVVGYWRGTWMLIDLYTKPLSPAASGLLSACIGFLGHAVFTSLQKLLGENLHPDKHRLIYYASSRLYTVCYAFTCVNGWRGPWDVLDVRFDRNVVHLVVTVAVGVLALIAVRGLKNVLAAPFVVVVDDVRGYFDVDTMFRMPMGEKTFLYILDCIFSILIVGTLVVFVWRGVWLLIDVFLFPDDFTLSSWISLALGYAIVATAFLLQPIMRYICERLTGTARLLVADIFILFALFGTVNVWRGIWNLLDIYFIPDNRELSCWICHWVSLIVLVLCRCSNSLLIRGVYIDAEEPEGKCVIFPCYYLRILLGKKKTGELNLAKENDAGSNKHVVDINTISDTVEENPSKIPK